MSHTEWARIEQGRVDPRLSSLVRIQHALDLDGIEVLFGRLPSRQLLQEDL
jgi:predicted transcriptional regulator